MEHGDVAQGLGRVDAANRAALLVGAGIALGREHDAERDFVAPAQVEVLELAVMRGHQRGQKVRLEPRHEHLAFRVAESGVDLEQLGPVGCEHEAGVEDAGIGRAVLRQAAHERLHNPLARLLAKRRSHCRRRGVGAHAAGVRPGIALADGLVVLRRLQRQHRLAVDQGKIAGLLAHQHLLDHELRAGFAEGAIQRVPRCIEGLILRCGEHNALAGGEPVGLDHHGRPLLGDERLGLRERGHAPIGGGRHAVARAQVLHEAFRSFDPCGGRTRAEGGDAVCLESVDEACAERRLRPHHHEVDRLLAAERDQPVEIHGVQRYARRLVLDPGVPRRAPERTQQRRRCELPAESMLAPARTHDQNIHVRLSAPIQPGATIHAQARASPRSSRDFLAKMAAVAA